MNPSTEAFSFAVGLVGGAFALVRYALSQNRLLVDRFATHLERTSQEHSHAIQAMREAIERLATSVSENTAVLIRLRERVRLDPIGGDPCSP